MTHLSRASFQIDECMKEPELPPSPLLDELSFQSILGIMDKYVNLRHGWRKRLCVLQGGVLRYYKADDGTSHFAILQILEKARENGDVSLIGNMLPMLERKFTSQDRSSSKTVVPSDADSLTPLGEIHLQVASVMDSQSGDNKRFTINSGTKKLRFRAESELDKKAWMDALRHTKEQSLYWTSKSVKSIFPMSLTAAESGESMFAPNGTSHERSRSLFETQTIPDIRQKLKSAGATDAQVDICEEFMLEQHKFYVNFMQQEAEKRTMLIQHIRSLEEDKRLLEQQIVVNEQPEPLPDTLPPSTSIVASEILSQEGSESAPSSEEDVYYDCLAKTESRDLGKMDFDILDESTPFLSSPERSDQSCTSKDTMYDPNGPVKLTSKELQDWIQENGRPKKRRDRLPKPLQKEKKVGLWAIIKECIGRDLTKVCLPVYFNEPVSALQKVCEELEYSHLIDQAIRFPPGSVERLLHISAWAVSGYGGTVGRTTKPFNPLLGETFEFVNPEGGYRFLGEKVVHHPTIFSLYCQGTGWEIAADTDLKNRFWGPSIELRPVGVILLKTFDGEIYKLNKVTTSINNLIIGKLEIDHYGTMKVQNLTSNLIAKIRFFEKRIFSRNCHHQVEGYVEGPDGKLEGVSLRGIWSQQLFADAGKGEGPFEIWRKNPPAVEPTRYNLSTFAIQLNELTEDIEGKVAPTDSRLRPDQRFLEKGMYDEANYEKQRLEHQQRAARKAAEDGDPIQPRWFTHVPGATPGEQLTFIYKGGYWDSRDRGRFEGCRDIFGRHMEIDAAQAKRYILP